MIRKFQKLYLQLNLAFDKHFGWFFTNGRKIDVDMDWLAH